MTTIELRRGDHRFVVRYEIGRESEALDAITKMVFRPIHPLTPEEANAMALKIGVNEVGIKKK